MDISWFDFGFACAVMAIGIGTDVALATLARAEQLRSIKSIILWIFGVSLTHTLFPMLGYLMTYFSVQVVPMLTPAIGILAALCIFWFLYHELVNLGRENDASDKQRFLVSLALILAVSWDALWSGPAKSAQVIGWPELLVWVSFILVGVVVSLLATSAFVFSKVLQAIILKSQPVHLSLLCMQYSVIAYFGFLAITRYTLNLSLAWYSIMGLSLTITGVLMLCRLKLNRFQYQ
ncbi:hypothetical protein ISG33_10745 [Glaciecola sp. MH2013]|uniref:hypothetical protein n=1 Tax=Glaciecola sp. MH2013 TaxID=2785524 RepID=UPI00189DB7E3|nr:hypothetical protein [Glaciecola sp. MH2013]MBF7073877.1 hypothetical protein [Glaciecola sp. MH2013]